MWDGYQVRKDIVRRFICKLHDTATILFNKALLIVKKKKKFFWGWSGQTEPVFACTGQNNRLTLTPPFSSSIFLPPPLSASCKKKKRQLSKLQAQKYNRSTKQNMLTFLSSLATSFGSHKPPPPLSSGFNDLKAYMHSKETL